MINLCFHLAELYRLEKTSDTTSLANILQEQLFFLRQEGTGYYMGENSTVLLKTKNTYSNANIPISTSFPLLSESVTKHVKHYIHEAAMFGIIHWPVGSTSLSSQCPMNCLGRKAGQQL